MNAGAVLSPAVTYHKGLLWFTNFEGERFYMSAAALRKIMLHSYEILS